MKAFPLPSVERVRQLLLFDPDTGSLTWRATGRRAGTDNLGYIRVAVDRRRYMAHRLAWLIHYGAEPIDQIDHINGDRADNRLSNLRQATNAINLKNAKMPKTNRSGVVGVSWVKSNSAWGARIVVSGVRYHLGFFSDKTAAVAARRRAEREYGFHPNHGRT